MNGLLGALADKFLSEARDETALLRVQVKRGADLVVEKREVRPQRHRSEVTSN